MFRDRADAGRQLVAHLREHGVTADVVLGVTRGGVPVARVVAEAFGCPLGAVVVQKITAPGREELALGAVAADGAVWLNEGLVEELAVDDDTLDQRRGAAAATATEKASRYREGRLEPSLADRRVVIVDDGAATGATAGAAVAAARERGAARVVLALPVAAREAVERLRAESGADAVLAVATPEPFGAVGRFYDRFDQVDDDAVRAALG